jgi:hypothetical protein
MGPEEWSKLTPAQKRAYKLKQASEGSDVVSRVLGSPPKEKKKSTLEGKASGARNLGLPTSTPIPPGNRHYQGPGDPMGLKEIAIYNTPQTAAPYIVPDSGGHGADWIERQHEKAGTPLNVNQSNYIRGKSTAGDLRVLNQALGERRKERDVEEGYLQPKARGKKWYKYRATLRKLAEARAAGKICALEEYEGGHHAVEAWTGRRVR